MWGWGVAELKSGNQDTDCGLCCTRDDTGRSVCKGVCVGGGGGDVYGVSVSKLKSIIRKQIVGYAVPGMIQEGRLQIIQVCQIANK